MPHKIEKIEGIGPQTGEAFRRAGIHTVDDLLEVAGDKTGRSRLAAKMQFDESRLLKCVNMADLFRIKGIASQYAELLEGAGVDTVKELKTRNVTNLVDRMSEVNAKKNLVRRTPSVKVVATWIEQAKQLPPKVSY